jgi:hypothetical protein
MPDYVRAHCEHTAPERRFKVSLDTAVSSLIQQISPTLN